MNEFLDLRELDEDEDRWEKVVDFRKIKEGGVSIDELLEKL
ncbi:MAG: hypothetical protein Q8P45_00660 [Candidatus Harrisonbacteria bacterium]|nr:hypothetical protein [Candidatus Harrisonbacteria bacterium]